MHYLVHIGYPKAASTWLQRNLFSGNSSCFKPLRDGHDGPYRKSGDTLFYDFIGKTAYINPYQFDAAGVRKKLEAQTERNAAATVISNEAWCGEPFIGGATGRILADRIYQVIPEATILIVVRSQPEMILSSYLHYLVRDGGKISIERFLRSDHWVRRPPFSRHFFQYVDLIGHYDRLFGHENVLVLPFEKIRESTTAFVTPLYEAIQRQPESNLPAAAANARNVRQAMLLSSWPWLNLIESRFIERKFSILPALTPIMTKHSAERRKEALLGRIHEEAADYYRAGNRRLMERIGCDLARMGYPV